jgi:pimeloyl-ACP methyl ester carboxylesterase
MQFSKKYFEMKAQFNPLAERTEFSGSDMICRAFRFSSVYPTDVLKWTNTFELLNEEIFTVPDEAIAENLSFTYYIFQPGAKTKYKKAILLLHGLNERSWAKYLAWAYYLAEKTGSPVILFPIAFHMNRSPEAWGNPRIMQPLHDLRKLKIGSDPSSTFANLALSERLTQDPLRFFTSGQQSANDLVKLVEQINNGGHDMFEKQARVNVFAYSIGAFLAQILFLANPEKLFSNSKLFLFCGGAFFNEMNGVSKLIMDKRAFTRLRSFYIDELNTSQDGPVALLTSMNKTKLGQAFLAMLAPFLMKSFREKRLNEIRKNTQVISLAKDRVIPSAQVVNAMNEGADVKILDFPFDYTHETPFPLNNELLYKLVDASFEKVFCTAAGFLG